MRLRKIFIPNKGFSLIEFVIVLGILAALGSFTLVISMESYRNDTFSNQQLLLIIALQKARSESLNGMCMGTSCTGGLPHGVHITGEALTIFQGTTYNASDDTNEVISLLNHAVQFGGLQDVTFAELSANTLTGTITMSDISGNSASITIGAEGQIIW